MKNKLSFYLRMVRETTVQSQVASYQKLLKWYLIPPCLTLSDIRYVSRVKWSKPGKGVASSPTPRCSSYRKGSLLVALDYGRQQLFIYESRGEIVAWERQKIEPELQGFTPFLSASFTGVGADTELAS